jgi:hypothetical protein
LRPPYSVVLKDNRLRYVRGIRKYLNGKSRFAFTLSTTVESPRGLVISRTGFSTAFKDGSPGTKDHERNKQMSVTKNARRRERERTIKREEKETLSKALINGGRVV